MKTIRRIVASTAIALTFTVIGFAPPVNAAPTTIDTSHIVEFWNSYGVPAGTQKELLAKVLAGNVTDAESEGVVPVSVVTSTVANSRETVSTFEDGSVSVTTVELPALITTQAVVSPLGVAGCNLTTYSGVAIYTNCKITATTPFTSIGFYGNFVLVTGAYNDYISDKGNTAIEQCTPGTCSKPVFSSWKQHEDSAGYAHLTYVSTYTWGGSQTLYVTLTVGGNTYN